MTVYKIVNISQESVYPKSQLVQSSLSDDEIKDSTIYLSFHHRPSISGSSSLRKFVTEWTNYRINTFVIQIGYSLLWLTPCVHIIVVINCTPEWIIEIMIFMITKDLSEKQKLNSKQGSIIDILLSRSRLLILDSLTSFF